MLEILIWFVIGFTAVDIIRALMYEHTGEKKPLSLRLRLMIEAILLLILGIMSG